MIFIDSKYFYSYSRGLYPLVVDLGYGISAIGTKYKRAENLNNRTYNCGFTMTLLIYAYIDWSFILAIVNLRIYVGCHVSRNEYTHQMHGNAKRVKRLDDHASFQVLS